MQQLPSVNLPQKALLALIVVCYLALVSIYIVVVPLGEGPDESGHMAYVLFLVRNGRLPDQLKGSAGEVPGEGHQPPLAYLLMTPAAEWLPGKTRRVILTPDPNFVWSGGDSPAAFARGSQEYWPWQGVPLAWHLARSVSALLGALTVLCAWGLARALRPDWPALALATAALLACNPQFLFGSALVSNDPLLTLLSAALLWAVAHALRGGRFPLRLPAAAVLGLLLGLALVTKQSALLLAPVALLAVATGNSVTGNRQPATGNSVAGSRTAASFGAGAGGVLIQQAPRLLRDLLIFGLTVLVVAGWWYVRNWQLYGDPLGLTVFKAEFSGEPFDWRNPAAWQSGLLRLHSSLWAYFGWTSVPSPGWVYAAIAVAELVALAGLVRALRQQATGSRQQVIMLIGCLLPLALALAWTVSFAFTAGLVAWQGRFLFPALAAISLALAAGLLAWGRTALLLAVAALALLAAASPFTTIMPAYRWYTLPEARALAGRGSPTYARFADGDRLGVEIQGWQLSPQPLRAGQPAQLTLTWHARTRVAKPWTIFIHLIDADGKLAFDSDGQPHGGDFPLTMWTPGDWLTDTRRLALPANLPPGRYTLRVGLFDQASGKRAPYFNDDDMTNVEGDAFNLAIVDVVR